MNIMNIMNIMEIDKGLIDGLFEQEINHYIDCLVHGTPCKAPAEDGITLMKILDAIYESASTGHEVVIA